MMEAASTSEMPVNFYHTTRCNISQDSHLHTRRRENLKSRLHHNPFNSFGYEICGQTDERARSLSFNVSSSLHIAKKDA
jgi:hypothetical protein